jgi:hypothetical protein
MRRLNLCILCLVTCAAVIGRPRTATVAAADDAPPEEKPPPPPVRQIYDVTDLLTEPSVDRESVAVLPLTELGRRSPPVAGSDQAQRTEQPMARSERIDQLVKLLEEIDTDIWRDNGGATGNIRIYETRLIITAPAQTHAKLAEFLGDLRKGQARPVRLRATWAALSQEELQSVLMPTDPTKKPPAVRLVDLAALERLKGAVRFRGEINCLNGQRVNLMAGRARSVLTDLEMNVGTGAAGFVPTIEFVLSGASLTAMPVVSGDGSRVTLELRSVTGRWDKSDAPPIKIPLPVADSGPSTKPARPGTMDLERLNMPVQVVATAVRIQTGVAAIIGGLTADAEPQHADDHRPVYLIMEVWAEGAAKKEAETAHN